MRAGELVRVDFGTPAGSEPGFVRPAVIVTATAVLSRDPRTLHVVPVTTNNRRSYLTDVLVSNSGLDEESVAQCHLCAVISVDRIVEDDLGHVGAVVLAQIRAVLGDLLDIG